MAIARAGQEHRQGESGKLPIMQVHTTRLTSCMYWQNATANHMHHHHHLSPPPPAATAGVASTDDNFHRKLAIGRQTGQFA